MSEEDCGGCLCPEEVSDGDYDDGKDDDVGAKDDNVM